MLNQLLTHPHGLPGNKDYSMSYSAPPAQFSRPAQRMGEERGLKVRPVCAPSKPPTVRTGNRS